MDEYKRRRRRSRAVMSMFLDSLGGSIDNVDVATFDSDGTDLKALVVGIEPIQDLHGYDNPWPAGGGANKLPPAAIAETKTASTGFKVTSYSDGHYHLSKTSAGGSDIVSFDLSQTAEASSGMYFIPKCSVSNGSVTIGIKDASNNTIKEVYLGQTSLSAISTTGTAVKIYFFVAGSVDTIEADIYPMLADSVLTTYSPYSNECPISGHSSVNVIVSPTLNPLDGTITNIPLGTTVYGGQLDVLTGVLTVTHAVVDTSQIGVYKSSAISSVGGSVFIATLQGVGNGMAGRERYTPIDALSEVFAKCTEDVWYVASMPDNSFFYNNSNLFIAASAYASAVEFNTAMSGVKFFYPLATPQTIQLTGQQIATFLGTNHVWCDSGKIIHLEY